MYKDPEYTKLEIQGRTQREDRPAPYVKLGTRLRGLKFRS